MRVLPLDVHALRVLDRAVGGGLHDALGAVIQNGEEPVIGAIRERRRPQDLPCWSIVVSGQVGMTASLFKTFVLPLQDVEAIAIAIRLHLVDLEASLKEELLEALRNERVPGGAHLS